MAFLSTDDKDQYCCLKWESDNRKVSSILKSARFFSFQKMVRLRNKRKLATVVREIQEVHPRNSQSRDTAGPRINADFITQMSEELEGIMTKKIVSGLQ